MKLLITGCGRSGTGYAAKALQAIGLEVGHEEELANGISDWRAVGWPQSKLGEYDLVLHQVRHPLGTIASWHVVTRDAWRGAHDVFPYSLAREGSLLYRCMDFWVVWNSLAEGLCDATYQVERFGEVMPDLLEAHVDLQLDWVNLGVVPLDYNTRKSQREHRGILTWDDLHTEDERMACKVLGMAQRYGYYE